MEKNKGGRPATIAEPWLSLSRKLGGVAALAAELKSARRTVNQWARRDRLPSKFARTFIISVFIKHGIEPPNF